MVAMKRADQIRADDEKYFIPSSSFIKGGPMLVSGAEAGVADAIDVQEQR